MEKQRVFDGFVALGYTREHAQALIDAEVERREKVKEETFREETEELLREMDP